MKCQLDANWRFPFFDLPGELRNLIYQELLTGPPNDDGIIKCHPQILATCDQANEEGSSIRYGENTIEIHLRPDGIFANGIKCGPYQPFLDPSTKEIDFTTIEWPGILSRCWHLQIETPKSAWHSFKPLRTADIPSGTTSPPFRTLSTLSASSWLVAIVLDDTAYLFASLATNTTMVTSGGSRASTRRLIR